ncbi:hypothetical protein [Microbulbifer sp. YPW1]|uniref:hypothetical protein n=1 Tax=Microbulbifer sp. YPW1 TaxID=2745199 RepID=UPI00159925F8|nr:hypothetical protein [Microbulbifer sp. YPW1]QKX18394.1 hypothetical protein HUW35_16285 [Microbulbifer sp. YPW1]
MSWKRILSFSFISITVQVVIGLVFTLMFGEESYFKDDSQYLLILLGGIANFLVYFFHTKGINSKFYLSSVCIFLVSASSSWVIHYILFRGLYFDKTVAIDSVVTILTLLAGTHVAINNQKSGSRAKNA